MKNYILYIVLGIGVLLFALIIAASLKPKERVMDERITLRTKDKIPYGTYVAYKLLPKLFPNAQIQEDKNIPGNWDNIATEEANQAVFIVAKDFNAEEFELERLFSFANKGNYVFIMAYS